MPNQYKLQFWEDDLQAVLIDDTVRRNGKVLFISSISNFHNNTYQIWVPEDGLKVFAERLARVSQGNDTKPVVGKWLAFYATPVPERRVCIERGGPLFPVPKKLYAHISLRPNNAMKVVEMIQEYLAAGKQANQTDPVEMIREYLVRKHQSKTPPVTVADDVLGAKKKRKADDDVPSPGDRKKKTKRPAASTEVTDPEEEEEEKKKKKKQKVTVWQELMSQIGNLMDALLTPTIINNNDNETTGYLADTSTDLD